MSIQQTNYFERLFPNIDQTYISPAPRRKKELPLPKWESEEIWHQHVVEQISSFYADKGHLSVERVIEQFFHERGMSTTPIPELLARAILRTPYKYQDFKPLCLISDPLKFKQVYPILLNEGLLKDFHLIVDKNRLNLFFNSVQQANKFFLTDVAITSDIRLICSRRRSHIDLSFLPQIPPKDIIESFRALWENDDEDLLFINNKPLKLPLYPRNSLPGERQRLFMRSLLLALGSHEEDVMRHVDLLFDIPPLKLTQQIEKLFLLDKPNPKTLIETLQHLPDHGPSKDLYALAMSPHASQILAEISWDENPSNQEIARILAGSCHQIPFFKTLQALSKNTFCSSDQVMRTEFFPHMYDLSSLKPHIKLDAARPAKIYLQLNCNRISVLHEKYFMLRKLSKDGAENFLGNLTMHLQIELSQAEFTGYLSCHELLIQSPNPLELLDQMKRMN